MPFLPPNQQRQSNEGTSCTTNAQQIEVMELELYNQPKYNKLSVSVRLAVQPQRSNRRRYGHQTRLLMSFVNNTAMAKFSKSRV